MPDVASYRVLAERSWAWAMAQVASDDEGLWLPEHTDETEPGDYPYGMHSGIGGLAHVLSEIRLTRPWTDDESALAAGIAETLTARIPELTEYDYFDGLVSTLGILTALEAPGAELAVARLLEIATPDGWPQGEFVPPRFEPDSRINDATLGTASVLLGAVWALRHGVRGGATLAERAIDVLVAERMETSNGLRWSFIPTRHLREPEKQMPNWSHGLAGIAGALAATGVALERPDLVESARLGAQHLVSTGDTSDGGLRLPHVLPHQEDVDEYTYNWCHGPAGTSLLFSALDRAGVPAVGDRTPYDWERACLHSLLVSGIPQRLHPGFWDNDGRCCGTAGVGDVVLSMWQRHGHDDELAFAVTLADALVERSINDGDHTYWRYLEHRNAEPLLPPRVGWMQGVAGIAAYLFRIARVLEQGRDAPAVARMDTWWTLP